MQRTPRNYDGVQNTNRDIRKLLPEALEKIGEKFQDQGSLVLEAWPEIIGKEIAPMTKAVSCEDGVLTVQVKNSTLHSLLSGQEKGRILFQVQKRFPYVKVQKIVFRRM